MKYYNLPTSQQIAAYHAGKLSLEKNQWIEKLMNSNPFVKSAVEEFPIGQHQEIQAVSERISGKINKGYIQKRGFWSRYGSWVSLSMVALLIGILALLNESPDNKYTQEGILIAEEQVAQSIAEVSEAETITENTAPLIDQNSNATRTNSLAENESITSTTVNSESQSEMEQEAMGPNKDMGPTPTVENDSESEGVAKPSGKLLKSVRSVNLISKEFDTSFKRNLPEYPGGDRALFDYFRTQLTPVELDYSESAFDASVVFQLTVPKEGMESSYEIDGALHPIHKSQLENCVNSLPRFKPGLSAVTYRLQIAFN